MKIYVFKKGDTLFSAARKNGCSVKALLRENSLSFPVRPLPGYALLVPGEHRCRTELFALTPPPEKMLPLFSFVTVGSCRINAAGSLIPEGEVLASDTGDALRVLSLSHEESHAFFADDTARSAMLAQLFPMLELCGIHAVLLDCRRISSFDGELWGSFVTTLSAALHARGYYLFTLLDPTEKTGGIYGGAMQPQLHNAAADRVAVHFPSALPISELSRCINTKLRGIDRERLLLSMFCGGEKCSSRERSVISPRAAAELALSRACGIRYDENCRRASFEYPDRAGEMQRVSFPDARTVQALHALSRREKLAGLAFSAFPPGIEALEGEKFT